MCGDEIVRVLDQFIQSDCINEIDNAGCADQSKYCPAQTFNQCMSALEQDTYQKNLASQTKREIKPPLWSPKRVATKPGCRQFAVTPVPCRRRASSRVNRMLHSFDRPSAFVAR